MNQKSDAKLRGISDYSKKNNHFLFHLLRQGHYHATKQT